MTAWMENSAPYLQNLNIPEFNAASIVGRSAPTPPTIEYAMYTVPTAQAHSRAKSDYYNTFLYT